MLIASSFYAISAYKRFHRNTVLSDSRGNLCSVRFLSVCFANAKTLNFTWDQDFLKDPHFCLATLSTTEHGYGSSSPAASPCSTAFLKPRPRVRDHLSTAWINYHFIHLCYCQAPVGSWVCDSGCKHSIPQGPLWSLWGPATENYRLARLAHRWLNDHAQSTSGVSARGKVFSALLQGSVLRTVLFNIVVNNDSEGTLTK